MHPPLPSGAPQIGGPLRRLAVVPERTRRPRLRSAKRSRALLRRAERVIPGGVNSPVRAYAAVGGSPSWMGDVQGGVRGTRDG